LSGLGRSTGGTTLRIDEFEVGLKRARSRLSGLGRSTGGTTLRIDEFEVGRPIQYAKSKEFFTEAKVLKG
jgi:hypothetical protein